MAERVKIFDTTLRDGEQSPGASMNAGEKLRLAIQLEKLGVDIIEAGFPAASEGDFEAVSKIAKHFSGSDVVIAGLCRAEKEDIEKAWQAVKHAKNARIHTFIATSDIHLEHKLQISRQAAKQAAVEAVKFAKTFCDDVEFSAEDGTRSDIDFVCEVFEAVIEAGAATVNFPDTVGYAIPGEFQEMVEHIIEFVPNIDKAVLSVHCHNDLGLATANTVAAICGGARQAEVTINGIGERAGNTSLEELVMALNTRHGILNYESNIKTEWIYASSRLVSMITGIVVQPNKAIVGANAFAHEAGIHQDGMIKNSMTYEIMQPETVGVAKSTLVLGKHSGKHAISDRLREIGYDLTETEIRLVFREFKLLADKKKSITDEDLESIVAETVLRTEEIYRLDYVHTVAGNTVMPIANVRLWINNGLERGAYYGNGPIDATFIAIANVTKTDASLMRFTVSSLTEGTDAQGEVTVRLQTFIKNGGPELVEVVALGRGSDPDIITASAKAYINALNRLEYLKKHKPAAYRNPVNESQKITAAKESRAA